MLSVIHGKRNANLEIKLKIKKKDSFQKSEGIHSVPNTRISYFCKNWLFFLLTEYPFGHKRLKIPLM